MTELRLAATVILLRDSAQGIQTLMLRRSRRAGFLPDAWVFPGGIVEPDDARAPVVGRVSGLRDPALAVAATRECFEEAGIWLGRGYPAPGLRSALQEGDERLEDHPSLRVDLGRLRLWSRWITPVEERRRYDTFFFVARVGAQDVAQADRVETVDSVWLTPSQALERQHLESFFIVPPTFRTLEELGALARVDDVWEAAADRMIVPILTVREQYPGAVFSVVLPGHSSYPSDVCAPGLQRISLIDGRWQSLP